MAAVQIRLQAEQRSPPDAAAANVAILATAVMARQVSATKCADGASVRAVKAGLSQAT